MHNAKTVLITGSLGYIGSRLVPFLQQLGWQVKALDTGYFRDCLLYPEIHRGDFTWQDMREFTPAQLEGVDAVIHLAGISNDPFGDLMPQQVYDFSRDYSVNLANLCKERGIKFVFASSCSIYGNASEAITDETSTPNPQTYYSVNKLEIEQHVGAMADHTFQPIFLRFATLFGPSPRMRFDIVVNMLTAMAYVRNEIVLNSDGKANRPFVHIEDACQAFHCALLHQQNSEQALIVNVGQDNQNFRVIDVAQMICQMAAPCKLTSLNQLKSLEDKELFKDRKLQDGVDSRNYHVSFKRLPIVFPTFQAKWSLQQGITELLTLYGQLKLSETEFKSSDFFRLQTMETLYKQNRITSELRWS
jgi:nucleoside-diphosphate-sugar epimerase